MSFRERKNLMYNEFSYVAKPKNKVAEKVLIGLLGSALIFVIAANLTPKYSGLVWTVAFAFIVSVIYVYTRYVGAEYCYSVMEAGALSFVVTQKVGKTVKTMARVDVVSIVDITRMSGKEYKKHKSEKGTVRYFYLPTMCPDNVYLLSLRSYSENADIFIEADESFIIALKEARAKLIEGYDPY